MPHYVYILASRPNGAIYIGRTDNLLARVRHHQMSRSIHTARYGIHRLVWYEAHETFEASLAHERRLKRWRRAWKNALIAESNPEWDDISASVRL